MWRVLCGCSVSALCCASIVGCSGSLEGAEPEETLPAEVSVRPRARELGIQVGILPPGTNNAITDVAGVLVGHCTVWSGEDVRTGATAILPHGGNVFQEKVPAAIVTGLRRRTVEAIPIDRVVEICRRYGVIRKRAD